MDTQTADISALKNRLAATGRRGLVVDLDETISATIEHWAAELLEVFGNPGNLSPHDVVRRMSNGDIPFDNPEEVTEWMIRALASEELTESYPIIEGADIALAKIDRVVPVVGYLTIRQDAVRAATQRWLTAHGFPDGPVITRPDGMQAGGMQWKAATLAALHPHVVAAIDDTADFIQYLPDDYPGTIFLYGKPDHAQDRVDVVPCPTWDDVYARVAERRDLLLHETGDPR